MIRVRRLFIFGVRDQKRLYAEQQFNTEHAILLFLHALLGCGDHPRHFGPKCLGEAHEGFKGGALLSALQLSNVADIVAKHVGELLLGPAAVRSSIR